MISGAVEYNGLSGVQYDTCRGLHGEPKLGTGEGKFPLVDTTAGLVSFLFPSHPFPPAVPSGLDPAAPGRNGARYPATLRTNVHIS